MNNDEQYAFIVQELKKQGVFSKLISKTWEKRPADLDPQQEITWFKTQLIHRGYVAEHVLAAIPQQHSSVVENPHDKFERFTLFEKIGCGGMSHVYRAFDPRLNKDVALKILTIRSDQIVKRFVAEGQIMARLHHQNIVKFYEVNQFQNQHYLTMDYIKGYTLREWISLHKPCQQDTVTIFQKIASAVQLVHEHGIVHRDLKPENIMIQMDKEPVIMDFGIAHTRQKSFSTVSILGTPNYMSPEQASGKNIDFRSDIFSLGTMFYEILTGRLPFVGDSDFAVFTQIVRDDPIPAKWIQPRLDEDLNTICLKCLEKDVTKRYQSARELVVDLQRFRNHQPILARPISSWRKLKKWSLRNKNIVVTTVIFLLCLVTLIAMYIHSLQKFSQHNARVAYQTKMRLAQIALSKSRAAYQQKKWRKSGVLAGATLEFALDLPGVPAQKIREHAQTLVRLNLFQHSWLWEKTGHGLMGNHSVFFQEKAFRVVDITTGKQQFSFPLTDIQRNVQPYTSRDGSLVAFSLPQKIEVWSIPLQKVVWQLPMNSDGYSIAFDPHNRYMSLRNKSETLIVNLQNQQRTSITAHPRHYAVAFSKNGEMFACSSDHSVIVKNLTTGMEHELEGHNTTVCSIVFIDKHKLAVSTLKGDIYIWNLSTHKKISFIPNKGRLLYVSDSQRLFASTLDDKIFLWDAQLLSLVQVYNTNHPRDAAVVFTNDDREIISHYREKISGWRIFYHKPIFTLTEQQLNTSIPAMSLIDLNYNSSILSYVPPQSDRVQLWDIDNNNRVTSIKHPDVVTDFAFHRQQNIAITSCKDGYIRVWQQNKLTAIHNCRREVHLVKMHPKNSDIIIFACDKDLFLLHRRSKKQIQLFQHSHNIGAICFSHDGQMIASAGGNAVICTMNGKILQQPNYQLSSHKPQLGFSADNKYLMICHFENTLLWNVATQQHHLQLNMDASNCGVFSPFYNDFIIADFRYRLINSSYGNTIQDFYAGWYRAHSMVSKADGTFAVCLHGSVVVLKLPSWPSYPSTTLPAWSDKFAIKQAVYSPSTFDVRPDIPGWFIEKALSEKPQLLTNILFDLQLQKDLSFDR